MSELTFEQYRKFVDNITSNESKQYSSFLHRLAELEMSDGHINQNVNIPRLLTASLGMMSEGEECGDIVKKQFLLLIWKCLLSYSLTLKHL